MHTPSFASTFPPITPGTEALIPTQFTNINELYQNTSTANDPQYNPIQNSTLSLSPPFFNQLSGLSNVWNDQYPSLDVPYNVVRPEFVDRSQLGDFASGGLNMADTFLDTEPQEGSSTAAPGLYPTYGAMYSQFHFH